MSQKRNSEAAALAARIAAMAGAVPERGAEAGAVVVIAYFALAHSMSVVKSSGK